jgi:hypothetical protein
MGAAMTCTRREAVATSVAAAAMLALPSTKGNSASIAPNRPASQDDVLQAQQIPPLPDIPDPEQFYKFLEGRFIQRAAGRDIQLASDGADALRSFIRRGVPIVFAKVESGPIDGKKDYRNLPLPIRQVIAIRNLDTTADIAIYVAQQKDKKITAEVLKSVSDFLCPMYPFCYG